jgi:hypothetical protein
MSALREVEVAHSGPSIWTVTFLIFPGSSAKGEVAS